MSIIRKRKQITYMRNTHLVQHSKDLCLTLVGRLFHRTAQGSTSRLGSSDRSGGLSSGSSLSLGLSSLSSLLLLALTGLLLVVGVLLNRDSSLFNDQSYHYHYHIIMMIQHTRLATKMGVGRISIWKPSRTRAASRVSGKTV